MTGLAARDTDGTAPFLPDEVAQIRAALAAGHGPLLCPRCATPLSAGEAVGGGTIGFFWFYHCRPCHRGVTIGDLRKP